MKDINCGVREKVTGELSGMGVQGMPFWGSVI